MTGGGHEVPVVVETRRWRARRPVSPTSSTMISTSSWKLAEHFLLVGVHVAAEGRRRGPTISSLAILDGRPMAWLGLFVEMCRFDEVGTAVEKAGGLGAADDLTAAHSDQVGAFANEPLEVVARCGTVHGRVPR